MKVVKNILLNFFRDEVSEVRALIKKTTEIPLDSRLTQDSRTILELINHIAQIPRIDVDIYSGKFGSGEKTHELEVELEEKSVEEVLMVFDDCCNYLYDFFEKLNDEDFAKKRLRPFYEPNNEYKSWNHFLPKLTAHLSLHKGILWSYMKVAKAKVNMFSYYGAE